jgi:hypothetical protein
MSLHFFPLLSSHLTYTHLHDRNCKPAVALLKVAAEKGPVAAALQLGHEEYFKGQSKQALWHYLQVGN